MSPTLVSLRHVLSFTSMALARPGEEKRRKRWRHLARIGAGRSPRSISAATANPQAACWNCAARDCWKILTQFEITWLDVAFTGFVQLVRAWVDGQQLGSH